MKTWGELPGKRKKKQPPFSTQRQWLDLISPTGTLQIRNPEDQRPAKTMTAKTSYMRLDAGVQGIAVGKSSKAHMESHYVKASQALDGDHPL